MSRSGDLGGASIAVHTIDGGLVFRSLCSRCACRSNAFRSTNAAAVWRPVRWLKSLAARLTSRSSNASSTFANRAAAADFHSLRLPDASPGIRSSWATITREDMASGEVVSHIERMSRREIRAQNLTGAAVVLLSLIGAVALIALAG